jgi:cysteine desulfuration protein SufE
MTPAEKQQHLVADFSHIPDRHERLAAIVERSRRLPSFTSGERIPTNRIAGCVSAVWLIAELKEGRLHFRSDAEAPVVRGLVALLCEIYGDSTPADIVATEPTLFDELGLARDLSTTRKNGLASVRRRIREIATAAQ